MVMNNCRRAVLRKAKAAQLVQKFASLTVFKRIRKIEKATVSFLMSLWPSVRPHGTARLSLDRFSSFFYF